MIDLFFGTEFALFQDVVDKKVVKKGDAKALMLP